MTRGKYAARAANREARLDNELIAEKVNQVAALKATIAGLETTLARERKDRGAEVIRRTDDLAAAEIAKARQQAARDEEKRLSQMRTAAANLEKHFQRTNSFPPFWFTEILPVLLPNMTATEHSDYIERLLDGGEK